MLDCRAVENCKALMGIPFLHVVRLCATLLIGSSDRETSRYLERVPKGTPSHRQSERQDCRDFLVKYMPERDNELSNAFLEANIYAALASRRSHDWLAAVPWPTFLNYVLPYAKYATSCTSASLCATHSPVMPNIQSTALQGAPADGFSRAMRPLLQEFSVGLVNSFCFFLLVHFSFSHLLSCPSRSQVCVALAYHQGRQITGPISCFTC